MIGRWWLAGGICVWTLIIVCAAVAEAFGPAPFAIGVGLAMSKWCRQCEAQAELERSLPAARLE